jgi:hypothetical protein
MAANTATKTIGAMLAHEDFPGLYERKGYWYARYRVKGVGVKKVFWSQQGWHEKGYFPFGHDSEDQG